jgi:hypothetical protein
MRSLHTGLAVALALATGLAALPAASQKAKPKPAAAKAAAPKAGKYGALAVDRSQGYVFAWAYDHPSRQAASEYALAECAKRDGNCTVVVEFAGEGCASYHTVGERDGSAYGWGTAPTREAAQARSLQECNAFAGGNTSCSNHVWACNSADVAPFKVLREDPVKPKAGKGDCLVQYDMDEENGSDDWVNRYRSPVYRLSAKDCPSTSTERYHSYSWDTREGGGKGGEYPKKDADAKRHERGVAMARDFSAWIMDKPTPGGSGTHYRGFADVYVTAVKDDILQDMLGGVAQSDSDRQHGVCLDFKPRGVVPVEVLGAERCRSWVR